MSNIQGALTGLAGATLGLGGAISKGTKAPTTPVATAPDKEIDNLYKDDSSALVQDVYKTTRMNQRSVLMSNYQQVNELAQGYQSFISVQKDALKQRLATLGGKKSPEGQKAIGQFKKDVEDKRAAVRNDIAGLRKKVGGNK